MKPIILKLIKLIFNNIQMGGSMSKLMGMFTGGEGGKISSMRVASLFTVFSVMAIFIAHNIVAMAHGQGLVSLSWELISLVTAVLGVKAYQHKNEVAANGSEEEEPDAPEAPAVPEVTTTVSPKVS